MTPQQIAEKYFPVVPEEHLKGAIKETKFRIKQESLKRKELTSLIRDLQKQTWDQACIEQREKCAHRLHKDQPKNLEEAIDITNFCPVKPFPSNL